jgi:GTP-binding protein EngB required for normal cell division
LFKMSSEEPNSAGYNGDIIIAVMGITGVGKSSFISTLTGRKDIVGHDLSSGKSCQIYEYLKMI